MNSPFVKGALFLLFSFANLSHSADIKDFIGKTVTDAIFTFYGQPGGRGACGINLDCQTMTAAASGEFFSSGSWVPSGSYCSDGRSVFNNPICYGICVTVTYKGKSVTVPINNECPECSTNWVDLTTSAFTSIAEQSVGKATGATLVYQYCNQTSITAANCECSGGGTTNETATTTAATTESLETTTEAAGGGGGEGGDSTPAESTTTDEPAESDSSTTTAESDSSTTSSSNGSGGGGGTASGELSVSVESYKTWGSGAHFNFLFTNGGPSSICSVTFKLELPCEEETLSGTWNMDKTSNANEFTLPNWAKISAGAIYNYTGVIVSGGTTAPTVSVVSSKEC